MKSFRPVTGPSPAWGTCTFPKVTGIQGIQSCSVPHLPFWVGHLFSNTALFCLVLVIYTPVLVLHHSLSLLNDIILLLHEISSLKMGPADTAPICQAHLPEYCAHLLAASLEELKSLAELILSILPHIPTTYLVSLNDWQLARAYQYILMCWFVTEGRICPREIQRKAVMDIWEGKDVFVQAGTGTGCYDFEL